MIAARNYPNAGKRWTKVDVAKLRKIYATASPKELEATFGRSVKSCRDKASTTGVAAETPRTAFSIQRVFSIPEESPQVQLVADQKLSGAKAEVKYYKRLYAEALKSLNLQTMVTETLRDVAGVVPPVTVKTTSASQASITEGRGRETDVLQLSDLHGGEQVEADEVMGLPAFDMAVLAQRLGTLSWKVLDLVNLRRTGVYIPKLIIAQEGDMLTGDVRPELVRTNIGHMMTVATRVASLVSQLIAFLSPHFDEIDIECVVGNHGRLEKRPYFKERYINWDYLCYQWQAMFCRELPNVTFHIPHSPFALFNAENTRVLITHGDPIRSWMGIPWYGIRRASLRLGRLLQAKGDYYDALLLGHFHNRADVDTAVGPLIINGSVKGGDEYSIGSLQTTNKPSQNLLHFHDEYGYIGGQPIYLEPHSKAPVFKDILPEVWADLID